ncbi:MAG: RpoL/Rpb11 RNA polymerase subunit family protein [Candidatus Micrarchaeota archaeon]
MKVEFLKDEKDEVKVKLVGEEKSLGNLIVQKLVENKDVEFAGCDDDHPLLANPVITIKGKNARKSLATAVDEVKKELKDLEKQVEKL